MQRGLTPSPWTTRPTATTIALTPGSGTTESGTLATGLSTNLYQFSGTAGQSLYFEGLSDSPSRDSSIAYLYGPSNSFSHRLLPGDQTRPRRCPTPGPYILAVAGQQRQQRSVSYQFEVFDNVNPTSALTLGTEVTGTIANPGDSHTYTFTGTAGQRLYYDGLAATHLRVCRADGPVRQQSLQHLLQQRRGPLHPEPIPGTYTLTIYSYCIERATGAYDFTLDDVSTATTIALTPGSGTTETGTLATGLTTNLYQFSGTAGQSLYFQGQQDSPVLFSALRRFSTAPATVSVTRFYLENDASVTLSSTGPYLLAVVGQTATTASVSYKFEVFDNVNPTSALTLGTEVTGTIANPGDSHTYTFTGTAGQRLYYDALAVTSYLPVCRADRPVWRYPLRQLLQRRRGPLDPGLFGHLYTDRFTAMATREQRGLTTSPWTTRQGDDHCLDPRQRRRPRAARWPPD